MPQKTVAVVGPECTGKTTLARLLADYLDAPYVEEYARGYLAERPSRQGRYDQTDLETIAQGQILLEENARKTGALIVVVDTDLLVMWVWWREKYGQVPEWLEAALDAQTDRHYLLMRPDIEWERDALRESPLDRDRLFEVYRSALNERGDNFDVIDGQGEKRLNMALKVLGESN
jgi:NadR type nicotinamide-nucleotide adenylyltransferase